MNRCGFGYDDAAYLLGALTPAQRAAYERHLPDCADCRAAVAELAVLPPLLARLDPATLANLTDPAALARPEALTEPAALADLAALADPAAVADSAPLADPAGDGSERLLAAAGRARRRQRATYAGAALAVAAVALAAGLAAVSRSGPPPGPPVTMVAMAPAREPAWIRAEVGLRDTQWGTEITMRCRYQQRPGYPASPYAYQLVAYGPGGVREQVGSWTAYPDQEVTLRAATRFGGAELLRLELVRYDGTVLLGYDVP